MNTFSSHGMLAQSGNGPSEVPVVALLFVLVVGLAGMAGVVWFGLTMMRRRIRMLHSHTGQQGPGPGLGELLTHGPAAIFYGPREHDLGWLAPPQGLLRRRGWYGVVHRRDNGERCLILTHRTRISFLSFAIAFRKFPKIAQALDRAANGQPLDGNDEPPSLEPQDLRGVVSAPSGRYLGDLNRIEGDNWPVHVFHQADRLTLVFKSQAQGQSRYQRSDLPIEELTALRERLDTIASSYTALPFD